MKAKIIILVIGFVFAGFGSSTFAQDSKETKKNSKESVLFDVSMTCENCKKRIEKNISFEKGVSDLKVDLPAKTVWVEYNTKKTSQEKLQKKIADLGYDVNVHKTENQVSE